MMGTRRTIVVVLLFAACQSSAPQPAEQRSAHSAPAPASCKPEAPVALEIATRSIDAGVLEVTARAIPSATVAALELQLVLPAHARALDATSTRFGATSAGQPRVVVTRVRVDARTSSITAIARVPVADVEMARTVTVAIGAPEPAPRTTVYALPDGELAREVRP